MLWEAQTHVPEIAIQCHSEVKTGPFRIFYTGHMGPMSSVPGPRRQCHKRPRLALLGVPIQCQVVCRDSAIRGIDPRFPYCTTEKPDQPFGDSIYSANRGQGAVCWGLSDKAMGGLDPVGFRFVLIRCLL